MVTMTGELVLAAIGVPGGDNVGWVQLARTTDGPVQNGTKKFEITADDLATYAADIRARPGRIPVDYDHSHAEGRGTKAAGWVVADSAELRNGGTELWAQVSWTPTAAAAIRGGEYAYISPEITFQTKKDGVLAKAKKFAAAALTNRPFLDLEAVTLAVADPPEATMPVQYGSQFEAELARVTARTGDETLGMDLHSKAEADLRAQGKYPGHYTQDDYIAAIDRVSGHNPDVIAIAGYGTTREERETMPSIGDDVVALTAEKLKAKGLTMDEPTISERVAGLTRASYEQVIAATGDAQNALTVTGKATAKTAQDDALVVARLEEAQARESLRVILGAYPDDSTAHSATRAEYMSAHRIAQNRLAELEKELTVR